jgi:organic hydroperoxide reductase OsmC/OhrA
MAGKKHRYRVDLTWTGDRGTGTSGYTAYERSHEMRAGSKPALPGSSDPSFRGDPARWNPEELLVASLSACHQLWYLHLCAVNGVIVKAYEDTAEGVMVETPDGAGQFESVTLRPRVTIASGSDPEKAQELHHEAHAKCFIARSMNFPVGHEPSVTVA